MYINLHVQPHPAPLKKQNNINIEFEYKYLDEFSNFLRPKIDLVNVHVYGLLWTCWFANFHSIFVLKIIIIIIIK